MNDARVRPMPIAQKAANALALLALAALIALRPRSALALAGHAVPLALALFGSTRRARAGVVARGWALAANAFGALAAAGMLVIAGVAIAGGRLDPVGASFALALLAPLLVLYVLNLRALVGPPLDATSAD